MAYSDPNGVSDPTTGQAILAAWGDIVRDDLEYVARNAPHSRVSKATTQSLTSGAWTAVTFPTETYDVGGMHSTSSNTSRLVIPAGEAGKYQFGGSADFDNNITGLRGTRWAKNGTALGPELLISSVGFCSMPTPVEVIPLVAGDYIELQARQDSGGALDIISATAWIMWVRV